MITLDRCGRRRAAHIMFLSPWWASAVRVYAKREMAWMMPKNCRFQMASIQFRMAWKRDKECSLLKQVDITQCSINIIRSIFGPLWFRHISSTLIPFNFLTRFSSSLLFRLLFFFSSTNEMFSTRYYICFPLRLHFFLYSSILDCCYSHHWKSYQLHSHTCPSLSLSQPHSLRVCSSWFRIFRCQLDNFMNIANIMP